MIDAPSWECDAVLSDGAAVHIRTISPDDGPRLVAFHSHLSPDTVYLRFFGAHPRLSPAEIERFTHVDGRGRVALVATLNEDIIGVARYDRSETNPREAEVAFVISDDHQGRGLGTLLLEQLAAHARAGGIGVFRAQTLPHNAPMLDVFRRAGFEHHAHYDQGVVDVHMDLAPTETLAAAIEERHRLAAVHSIERLLKPRSIAVIGAGEKTGTIGHEVFANLIDGNFCGPLYPVHPTAQTVAGVKAYPTVTDVPDHVDLAVIAVPSNQVASIIEQCAEAGVRTAVVISAGFAEVDTDGGLKQGQLVRQAHGGGMRVVGPNCMGVINTAADVQMNATFAPVAPRPGRVAFASQSGGLGIAVLEEVARRGIGLSSFVSMGNKADVSGNDLLQYWAQDPDTDVILLVPGVLRRRPPVRAGRPAGVTPQTDHRRQGRSDHLRPAGRVVAHGRPGHPRCGRRRPVRPHRRHPGGHPRRPPRRRPSGRQPAHPGRTQSRHRWQRRRPRNPGRRRLRIRRTARGGAVRGHAGRAAFLPAPRRRPHQPRRHGRLRQRRRLSADPPPGPSRRRRRRGHRHLRPTPRDRRRRRRPGHRHRRQATRPNRSWPASSGWRPHRPRSSPPTSPFRTSRSPSPPSGPWPTPATYGQWRRRSPGHPVAFADIDVESGRRLIRETLDIRPQGGWLAAADAYRLLDTYRIGRPRGEMVATASDAAQAASAIGYPVALKAGAADLLHKTDKGAVRLGLRSASEVEQAYAEMEHGLGDTMGGALVQAMAEPGVEVIVGIVHDRAFGPLLMYGTGGTTVELFGDRTLQILPITDTDTAELVRSTRGSALLFGYRGSPPVDVAGLEDLILRVAQLAQDHPQIAEMDLNPVIVGRHGAVAVDAKLRIAPVDPDPTIRLTPSHRSHDRCRQDAVEPSPRYQRRRQPSARPNNRLEPDPFIANQMYPRSSDQKPNSSAVSRRPVTWPGTIRTILGLSPGAQGATPR